MSFDYTIKADGSQAQQTNEKVTDGLRRIESAAARAGVAIGGMAKSAATPVDGLTRALRAEQEVLERIHGPLQRYQTDLGALDKLYRQNIISVQEYNRELEAMNRRLTSARGGSAPSAPVPARGGASGGGAGLATAAAGYLTAGAAVGVGREILDLAGSYQQLENRFRSVATTQGELNKLMDKTHGIADRTRSDWGATGEAFVRMTRVTKDLGLSQDRVLRVTETLAKATKLQGATSEEASASMIQLSQALQSGVLAGDEFKSLSENMPELLNKIAETMGVPRSALKKLASEGKVTSDIVIKSIEGMANDVDIAFGRMKPTLADAWTKFKNDTTETAGKMLENSNVMEVLTKAITAIAQGFKDLAGVLGPLINVAGKVVGVFSDIKDALGPVGTALDYLTSPLKLASKTISLLGDAWDYVNGKQVNWLEQVQQINVRAETMRSLAERGEKAWRGFGDAIADIAGSVVKAGDAIDKFFEPGNNRAFFGLGDELGTTSFSSFKRNNDEVKAIEDRRKAASAAQRKFMEETREFRRLLEEGTVRKKQGASVVPAEIQAEYDAAERLFHLEEELAEASRKAIADQQPDLAADLAAYDKMREATFRWKMELQSLKKDGFDELRKGAVAGLNEIKSEIFDISTVEVEAMKNAFRGIEDNLVEAFRGGKTAWAELAKAIEGDLLRIALRLVEMRLIMLAGGGGGAGAGLGGSTFLTMGGNHATGGSYTERRAGGTDSHMVMFRMSTGERADFVPRGTSGGGAASVVNHMVFDPRQLTGYIGTAAGQRAVFSVIKSNPRAFRAALERA